MVSQAFHYISCSSVLKTVKELGYGLLICSGKTTITGIITALGRQFEDWTAYYRVFSKARINMDATFEYVFSEATKLAKNKEHVILHLDDSLVTKSGKKIPGAKWRRDPLGPPFHTNFIWGQRFLKLSVSVPSQEGIGPSRSVPVRFTHCPSADKPNKKANAEQINQYKEQLKQKNLNQYALKEICHIRNMMDQTGKKDQKLVLSVDGSFTNGKILKGLPEKVSLVGRIRKDAKFNKPAVHQPGTGRRRIYGEDLPTPEEIRQSDEYPWQIVKAWAAGKIHDFRIKVVDDVMWRKAGKDFLMRLIIISPLGYRLTKNSRMLYRRPAYLLCTDPKLDIQDSLQYYLWRWQIEVNIEECKGAMGVGKAQVRHINSVELVPAFIVAIYSLLLLSYLKCQHQADYELMPRPKWYPYKKGKRITTGDLIKCFRAQMYCKAMGMSYTHFLNLYKSTRSPKNMIPPNNSTPYPAKAS